MPAYNFPLRENVRQAFAGGQGNAFQTMLRMVASTVPGGIEAQNAYIARMTGASVRTVRRWRNQGVVPNGIANQEKVFISLYRGIVLRDIPFHPVGFRYLIEIWGKDAFSYAELGDLYEQRLLRKFKGGKPLPLTQLQRMVESALRNLGEGSSGAINLFLERATDPNRIFEVTSTRVARRRGGKTKETESTYTEEGYLDFFDPYDLHVMTAKLAAAIEAGGKALTTGGMLNTLEALYRTLTFWYGFYSPGNTKSPHSAQNPTAAWMRWLERLTNLLMEV